MPKDNAFPALLLNADWQPLSHFPLSTLPWKDSVKGIYEGTHVVVKEYEEVLRSPTVTMRIPSVVALKTYVKPSEHVAFTRFNVFLRDRFKCQYCGNKFATQDLTFDHVVPRARGGVTAWDNIVAACEPCNSRKDHGSLMVPQKWPEKPTVWELMKARKHFPPNYLHETWIDYLFWDSELEE